MKHLSAILLVFLLIASSACAAPVTPTASTWTLAPSVTMPWLQRDTLTPTGPATATPTWTLTGTATLTPTETPIPQPEPNAFYVATEGSNSASGALDAPFATIQYCLNLVTPGHECIVREGTYNEALRLVTSGTADAPITLKNYPGETVTILSGGSLALRTTGFQSFYNIQGLRLISNLDSWSKHRTVDFSAGIYNASTGHQGNNHITLRDCYVEGAVMFYGDANTVENCEFNGRNVEKNAIHFWFEASTNAVIRHNLIHDYLGRAVWLDNSTDNALVEGNTVYNTYQGIDCDGAQVPVTNCHVIGNIVYNTGEGAEHKGWGCSIFLENAFGAVVDRNLLYDNPRGNGIYMVNYGSGPDYYTKDSIEYRLRDSDITVSNNIFYNHSGAASVLVYSTNGVRFINNTIVLPNPDVHAVEMYTAKGTSFHPANWTVENNIFAGPAGEPAWWVDNESTFYSFLFSHNLYFHRTTGTGESALSADPLFVGPTDFHLRPDSPARDAGTAVPLDHDFDGFPRPKGDGYDMGAYEQ